MYTCVLVRERWKQDSSRRESEEDDFTEGISTVLQ